MKLDKAIKLIDSEYKETLDAADKEGLKSYIVQAEQAMKQVEAKLEANQKYQSLKEALKDVTASKKEVFARQKAIIAYVLHLLEEKGL